MAGLDFLIPFDGDPDPTLPYADDVDAMVNPGSLVLIEPAHSADPVAGSPAAGTQIAFPNIAWKRAAALFGTGTRDSLALQRGYTADGAQLKTERTPKGGLHVIISQNGAYGGGFGIQQQDGANGQPYAPYLQANRNHQFYYSRWERITRGCPAAQGEPAAAFIGQSTGLFQMIEGQDGGFRAETVQKSFSTRARSGVGNRIGAAQFSGRAGGDPAFTVMLMFGTGVVGPWFDAPQYDGKGASAVLYRAYLEDLTVSGRSYEQALAADRALYADAFAVGGRYYGDTLPTDPATIP